ncbi:uncharacterized protein [Halyomorpha halys]|uniref:uncharacterized protein n=1 Tax=Halyomorpha halys TaxID=286706 RepID=UPI0006D503AD|nr:histone acetyltransferase KAT6A-like [Halyomorpha halys]
MAPFDEDEFEEKLLYLKDTQDSIGSLSGWCLMHQEYHEKIVSTWLNVLKKVKIEHRLVLFYLANDVIQYSRRKSLPFVDSFAPALQKATKMVREDNHIRNKVMRLFKIWSERGVYEENFLVELSNVLNRIHKNIQSVDVQEFQSSIMYSKIRRCKELEEDTDTKLNTLNKNHISFTDVDKFRTSLKDREHGDELLYEIDGGAASCNAYITSLETEMNERQSLIDYLEIAEEYYEREFQEAKIVVNAYKCFATRVRGVKRKLEEKIESMPSPIPSPDVNAPSPSPEPKDNIYSDLRYPADSGPGNYFPSSETKKESLNISPYSPNSDFESEPVDSTYVEEEHGDYEGKTPIEKNGISSNSSDSKTAPSNEFSGSFSNESFHRDQSFLGGVAGGNNFNIFQGRNSSGTSSEWQQLSLSALLQTLMPSEGPAESSCPKNEVPESPKSEKCAKEEETWESPESPPLYEKANYPTIADEQILSQDTDMRFADVDDRNLLDFNDSANPSWPGDDIDYRTEGKFKKSPSVCSQNQDNVENVDMEMSDDEEKIKTKETDSKHLSPPVVMSGDVTVVSHETPEPGGSKEGFMNTKETIASPLILNQNAPSLCNPNPTPYNNSLPYNDSCYNYPKPGATYSIGATYSNNSVPHFPNSGKGDTSNMLPLLPPPPPPPPPPHPPQLWSAPFAGPPPQFGSPQNFVQQSAMFFPRPPPPVIPNPNPQMPVVNRPYRGNFRPFQRLSSRFQRW